MAKSKDVSVATSVSFAVPVVPMVGLSGDDLKNLERSIRSAVVAGAAQTTAAEDIRMLFGAVDNTGAKLDMTYSRFTEISTKWKNLYQELRGCEPNTAKTAFSRLFQAAYGLPLSKLKPLEMTDAAIEKRIEREQKAKEAKATKALEKASVNHPETVLRSMGWLKAFEAFLLGMPDDTPKEVKDAVNAVFAAARKEAAPAVSPPQPPKPQTAIGAAMAAATH